MRVLVTGNLGYIGPVLGKCIKTNIRDCELTGMDSGIFIDCTTALGRVGDTYYDIQIFKDVREITINDLKGHDCVISLAAVSNDPIGKDFSEATKQINQDANVKLYGLCEEAGVERLIIASSCSVYGAGGNEAKKEDSPLDPISEYAKSKVNTEEIIKQKAEESNTKCLFLRFATACGASDRLRLDLVLNDFVASAITKKEIIVLSDGSPWRPIIDVKDMAKSIIWGSRADIFTNSNVVILNVGSNEWNFQIKELATICADMFDKVKVNINTEAAPDKRSYKVDFSMYEKMSGNEKTRESLQETIREIAEIVKNISNIKEIYDSSYIRLNKVRDLMKEGLLDKSFRWIK